VLGVTSAAVIWMLAAIGCLVGFNHHREAMAISALTVLLLVGIGMLEGKFPNLRTGVHSDQGHANGKTSVRENGPSGPSKPKES